MNSFLVNRKIYFSIAAAIALTITFTSMLHVVRSAYDSYWVAIERVQTVDFNILASTSTGTVSEIIKSGNTEKAKEFVSSNYCLFRVQIEECVDPDCQNRSLVADNAVNESARCRALKGESEGALEIPVFKNSTTMATVRFDHAYSEFPEKTLGKGDQIGLLTLSRVEPISFDADFQSFLYQWLRGEADASRHEIYKTGAYVGILLGTLVFALLFIVRQFYLSYLKRKTITEKLVRLIDQKIEKTVH
jgi:hypothetical protein